MSELLIPIDKDSKIAENGWREIPEFSDLVKKFGDGGMKAVIISTDSGSMYRRFDMDIREEKACKIYFGSKWEDVIKDVLFQNAKFLYMELDYDYLYESRRVYELKLKEITDVIASLPFSIDNSQKISAYSKMQEEQTKRIAAINKEIEARGVIKKDFAGSVMTGIEKFQERARKRKEEHTVFRNKKAEDKTPEPEEEKPQPPQKPEKKAKPNHQPPKSDDDSDDGLPF